MPPENQHIDSRIIQIQHTQRVVCHKLCGPTNQVLQQIYRHSMLPHHALDEGVQIESHHQRLEQRGLINYIKSV